MDNDENSLIEKKENVSEMFRENKENAINQIIETSVGDIGFESQPMFRKELKRLMFTMPDSIRRQHGCVKCEWKGVKSLCMLVVPGEKIKKDDHVPMWICPRRAAYLSQFVMDLYPNVNKQPFISVHQWRKSILESTTHQQQMKDTFKFEQIQVEEELLLEKISELKSKSYRLESEENELSILEHDLEKVQKRLDTARNNWRATTNNMMFFMDKQIDRDTPKKQEITNITVNPSDIAKMIRSAEKGIKKDEVVIDGEYK